MNHTGLDSNGQQSLVTERLQFMESVEKTSKGPVGLFRNCVRRRSEPGSASEWDKTCCGATADASANCVAQVVQVIANHFGAHYRTVEKFVSLFSLFHPSLQLVIPMMRVFGLILVLLGTGCLFTRIQIKINPLLRTLSIGLPQTKWTKLRSIFEMRCRCQYTVPCV